MKNLKKILIIGACALTLNVNALVGVATGNGALALIGAATSGSGALAILGADTDDFGDTVTRGFFGLIAIGAGMIILNDEGSYSLTSLSMEKASELGLTSDEMVEYNNNLEEHNAIIDMINQELSNSDLQGLSKEQKIEVSQRLWDAFENQVESVSLLRKVVTAQYR